MIHKSCNYITVDGMIMLKHISLYDSMDHPIEKTAVWDRS